MEHTEWINGATDKLMDVASKHDVTAFSLSYNVEYRNYGAMSHDSKYNFYHGVGETIDEAIGDLDKKINEVLNTKAGKINDLRKQLAELEA